MAHTTCEKPVNHSSRSRSLTQEMPIMGICAQLEQFLLCAPRCEETTLRHVTPMPQPSFVKAPSPARMVTELFSACSVSHMPLQNRLNNLLPEKSPSLNLGLCRNSVLNIQRTCHWLLLLHTLVLEKAPISRSPVIIPSDVL